MQAKLSIKKNACWQFLYTWYAKNIVKIPLASMGVLAPRSAHARPSARPPIDTSGNLSAHISGGGGGKLSDSFLINFLAKLENSKHFSFFSKKN